MANRAVAGGWRSAKWGDGRWSGGEEQGAHNAVLENEGDLSTEESSFTHTFTHPDDRSQTEYSRVFGVGRDM